jgi:oligopeptide transport system substrate-binding protein
VSRKRISLPPRVLFAILLLLAACSQRTQAPATPKTRALESVTVGVAGTLGLDPATATGASLAVIASACEQLVSVNPRTLLPEPALVKSWKVESGAKKIRLDLRSGVKLLDGASLEAETVAKNLSRVVTPAVASPWASLLSEVDGFAEVQSGTAPELSGVKADGRSSLTISLSSADADFVSVLAHPGLTPVSLEEPSQPAGPAKLRCAGPYEAEAPGDGSVRLTRVGKGDHPAAILVKSFGSESDAFDALKRKEVNVAPIPNAKFAEGEAAGFAVETATLPEITYLAFNPAAPDTTPPIRQAISLALNRLAIIDAAFGDDRPPADGWLPAQSRPNTVVDQQCPLANPKTANVEGAKAAAGQAPPPPGPLSLRFDSAFVSRLIAQSIEVQVKQGSGIALEAVPVDASTLQSSLQDHSNTGVWMLSMKEDFPVGARLLESLFRAGSAANLAGFSSPDFDKQLADAKSKPDVDARRRAFIAAENTICSQMPAVPLWSGVTHWAVDASKARFASPTFDIGGNFLMKQLRRRSG